MFKKIFWAITFTASTWFAQANENLQAQGALQNVDRKFFVENKGQWHADVLYLCRMGGLDAWITKYGVNYTFFKLEEVSSTERKEHAIPDKFEHKNYNIIGHRVLMKLQNYNPNPAREGKQKQEGYYNYFIGNDPSKHASYVGLYKEVVIKDVYNGIDLRYYFDKGSLRYDYVVHPGADPSQIVFTLEGSDKTYVNERGNLVFTTRFGEVAMAELKTYQERDKKVIKSEFIKREGKWGITLANYDKTQALIIDPLVYSTYIGGSNDDWGYGIAVDVNGNAYVTGYTNSTNYDVTPGAFQTTYGGGTYDVFVTKLNASGSALVYSTYIGGSYEDRGYGIAVDGIGNAYVTGRTLSTNYAVTPGAFQTTYGGSWDVFVTKLNASGSALVYSTYIGGSNDDRGSAIAVDGSGNAYVTGQTGSTDYDVTAGAFQTTYGGIWDVFVTKLNASGSGLVYSTYIGGSVNDEGYAIAVDGSGNAYVTGRTRSTDYDVTPGAFQTTHGGGTWDVFVTKLNANGSGLVYSTYIGGSHLDEGHGIAIDVGGNAYVTGGTYSTDYDVTPGAFQTTHGGGGWDVFVTKLNASGSSLVYSTYIGGSDIDAGYGIAVDGSGHAYVTGGTWSTNYDVTAGAFQTTKGGNNDVFVTKLNASGSGLVYSTYIGGSNNDWGYGIAVDGSGHAYVTGETQSTDYDVTPGAFQTTGGGSRDVFVTKLCPGQNMTITLTSVPATTNQTVCINTAITNITYSSTGATGATFSGLPTGVTGNYSGGNITISGTPTVSGTFNYTVTLTGGCGTASATGTITVNTCGGTNIWLGGGTSDWHTGSNWSMGIVPHCAMNISIPAGNTPYPIVSTPASCGSITVGDAVNIVLNANLNVCGNWTGGSSTAAVTTGTGWVELMGSGLQNVSGRTTFNTLRINKNVGACVLGAGAIVDINEFLELQNGNFDVTAGTLTFKSPNATTSAMLDNFSAGFSGTITGNIFAERGYSAATHSFLHKQHYFSSPMNNVPIAQFAPPSGADGVPVTPKANCDETELDNNSNYGNVFEYDESNVTFCYLEAWRVRSAGTAQNGRGYSVVKGSSGVLTLNGAPNLGNYTVSGLTNSGWSTTTLQGNTYQSGWHLLGNPYLASIDLDHTANPDFDNAVLVLRTHGPLAGTYQPVTMSGTSVLPPFQGFMARKSVVGGTATFTFNNTNRSRTTETFYKNGEHQMSLTVAGNGYSDITYFNFDPHATTGYDADKDGAKLSSMTGQPTLYSVIGSTWASINTNPDVPGTPNIPLGFSPGNDGVFQFTASGFEDLANTTVYLEDKKERVMHHLSAQPQYTFSAAKTDPHDRFVLHFHYQHTVSGVPSAGAEALELFPNPSSGVLYVSWAGVDVQERAIEITDMKGKLVWEGLVASRQGIDISQLAAGVYQVKIAGSEGVAVKRLVKE